MDGWITPKLNRSSQSCYGVLLEQSGHGPVAMGMALRS